MPLVHDDHMIEQVAAAGADEPLCDNILPWAFEGSANSFYAENSRSLHNFSAES